MSKSMKIFMALALAVFMSLGTVPVNTVRAETPVTTETTEVTGEETPANNETGKQEEAPAESSDPAPAEDTAPVTEEVKKEEETTPPASEASEQQEENTSSEKTEVASEEENKEAEPSETEGTETSSEKAEETAPVEEEVTEEKTEVTLIEPEAVTYNGVTVKVSYYSDTFEEEVSLVVSEAGAAEASALKEAFGEGYKAVDISFVDSEGNKLQPLEGKSVNVSLTAEGMENAGSYLATHVTSDGKVEIVDGAPKASERTVTLNKTKEAEETINVPAVIKTVIVEDTKEVYVPAVMGTRQVEKTKEVEVPAQYEFQNVAKTRTVTKTRRVEVPVVRVWWNPLTWFARPTYKTEKYTTTETYYVKELVKVADAYIKTETYYETEEYEVTPAYTKTEVIGSHPEEIVISEAYTKTEKKTVPYTEDVIVKDVSSSFTADSFSVYAIVPVDPDGGINFEETYAGNTLSVKAPAGAFDEGTVMKIEMQDDPDVLANALKVLEDNTYSFYAIDISFWKGENEVEPRLPVEVTWISANINASDRLVHIKDDGTAELVKATVEDNKAVFIAKEFSTYTTTRLSEIDLSATNGIIFYPSSLTKPAKMASGYVAETHPEFDGYTFDKAVIVKNGAESTNPDDEVIYLGSFIYQEGEEAGTVFVYYRTVGTQGDSDLIVKLAQDELVCLKYNSTPLKATYVVRYNGTDYTLGAGGAITDEFRTALGSDADSFSLNGPASVSEDTEIDKAITLSIPRGYSARVAINGTNVNTINGTTGLGQYSEPTYTLSSDNKVITKSGDLTTYGVYDFIAVDTAPTVRINLDKRASFKFDASYFLSTVYTGGRGTGTMGDSTVNTNSNARITGDGTLGRNGTGKGTKSFTADSVSWSFTTNNTESSHWLMDALEINGTTIEIPYGDSGPVSKTTALPTGTTVTVTLNSVTGTGRSARRNYTIAVSNAYENIVISGGNIYNADNSTEIIPEVLDNVIFDFYGFDSSDNAYSSSVRPGWISGWGVGEPIAVGPGNQANSGSYDMYRFGQTNNNAMRFSLPAGYVNPELAYVTSTEGDLHNYVSLGSGLSFGSGDAEHYYSVNGNPSNGYYYFRITGIGNNNKLALLRIKADLARYGVSYAVGNSAITDYTIPEYDFGGFYDDAQTQLQGYNVVDNKTIVIAKSAPVDNTRAYTFLYYTIQGDSNNTHYAPSQKVALADVAKFGVYDSAKGEYVIPLVAHWQKSEEVDKVNITAKIYLDGELKETVVTSIPEESSVYIDIDSETMTDFMDKYNWQLFYDEVDSDPFVNKATEDETVELRLYSKFYIYHSSTGKLELHTTKELEKPDGTIGTLNIVNLTNPGYLYGGYYMDYKGAHDAVSGDNLVKVAADDNNENGTLTTTDITTLHNGGAVKITTENGTVTTFGTPYDPATNVGHVGYWEEDKAYTATEVTLDSKYSGNRGAKDTAALQTGGVGTEVKIARAGIYYLKEVPNSYLRPTHFTTYQRYAKYLREFIFLSTTDDMNYTNAGFVIDSNYTENDYITDELKITFGPNFDETTVPEDGVVKIKVDDASTNKGGYVFSKLWFQVNESNKDYSAILNSHTFKPYWVTYDGITVTGAMLRRETIKDKSGNGIIEVDSGTKEISFVDLAVAIKALKK